MWAAHVTESCLRGQMANVLSWFSQLWVLVDRRWLWAKRHSVLCIDSRPWQASRILDLPVKGWRCWYLLACFGLQLTENDQEPYRDFPLVVSERWQLEIAETVFDVVNQEADRADNKRRAKHSQPSTFASGTAATSTTTTTTNTGPPTSCSKSSSASNSETGGGHHENTTSPQNSICADAHSSQINSDCIVEGDLLKLVGPFFQTWQRKYLRLFPNRLEIYSKSRDGVAVKKGVEVGVLTASHLPSKLNCSPQGANWSGSLSNTRLGTNAEPKARSSCVCI